MTGRCQLPTQNLPSIPNTPTCSSSSLRPHLPDGASLAPNPAQTLTQSPCEQNPTGSAQRQAGCRKHCDVIPTPAWPHLLCWHAWPNGWCLQLQVYVVALALVRDQAQAAGHLAVGCEHHQGLTQHTAQLEPVGGGQAGCCGQPALAG